MSHNHNSHETHEPYKEENHEEPSRGAPAEGKRSAGLLIFAIAAAIVIIILFLTGKLKF